MIKEDLDEAGIYNKKRIVLLAFYGNDVSGTDASQSGSF